MKKLIKIILFQYSRKYKKTKRFVCVREQVDLNFCRCICIPNSLLLSSIFVISNCYDLDYKFKYIINDGVQLSSNDYKKEIKKLEKFICKYTKEIKYFDIGKIQSEICLSGEKLNDIDEISKNYFCKNGDIGKKCEIFCFMANKYRMEFDTDVEYRDRLFRLFIVLFFEKFYNIYTKENNKHCDNQYIKEHVTDLNNNINSIKIKKLEDSKIDTIKYISNLVKMDFNLLFVENNNDEDVLPKKDIHNIILSSLKDIIKMDKERNELLKL